MTSLLSSEDFEGRYVHDPSFPFEMLLDVVEVAAEKYDKEKAMKERFVEKNNDVGILRKEKPAREKNLKNDETRDPKIGVLSSRQKRLRREKLLKKPATDQAGARPQKQVRFHAPKLMISAIQAHASESGRKRSSESSELDDTDSKKQKGWFETNEGKSSKKSPKTNMPTVPNAPPDLPEELKHRIKAMDGTGVVMVIQKALTKTDRKQNHNRLSMPFGQINTDFLREEEREYLRRQQAMEVPFIEPSHKFSKMVLRQWDMPKDSGKTSSMYALRTHWFDVAEKNQLHPGDVVQIWSFRVGNEEQLCLALVVVSRKLENHGGRDNVVGSSSRGREGKRDGCRGCKSDVEDASASTRGEEGARGGGGSASTGRLLIRFKYKPNC